MYRRGRHIRSEIHDSRMQQYFIREKIETAMSMSNKRELNSATAMAISSVARITVATRL